MSTGNKYHNLIVTDLRAQTLAAENMQSAKSMHTERELVEIAEETLNKANAANPNVRVILYAKLVFSASKSAASREISAKFLHESQKTGRIWYNPVVRLVQEGEAYSMSRTEAGMGMCSDGSCTQHLALTPAGYPCTLLFVIDCAENQVQITEADIVKSRTMSIPQSQLESYVVHMLQETHDLTVKPKLDQCEEGKKFGDDFEETVSNIVFTALNDPSTLRSRLRNDTVSCARRDGHGRGRGS